MPGWSYFAGSAVFHYLGPAFAVMLFARLAPAGVAGLRIGTAALVFALWRRPWRRLGEPATARWGLVLAVMNLCFYEAVARLPLGTVAAIEFVPAIALAAARTRGVRNAVALLSTVAGVSVLTDVRLAGAPLGFVFAFANAALFGLYVVLAHRVAQSPGDGVAGLAAAMLVAAMLVAAGCVAPLSTRGTRHPRCPIQACSVPAFGVGISSSVIPYVRDQLAMARMTRATYALLVSLLPTTAAVIGAVVLGQLPMPAELACIGLVVVGTALHRHSG